MSLTIPEVRDWTPDELNNTAVGLRGMATDFKDSAVELQRDLDNLKNSSAGVFFDQTSKEINDQIAAVTGTAENWNNAAAVLESGAKELAGFRDSILSRVDNPESLIRPGLCGGSRPWKRGWSHVEGAVAG